MTRASHRGAARNLSRTTGRGGQRERDGVWRPAQKGWVAGSTVTIGTGAHAGRSGGLTHLERAWWTVTIGAGAHAGGSGGAAAVVGPGAASSPSRVGMPNFFSL